MKCYYPKDSNGNIIGFKTPESQVYDKSGKSLTDRLQEKADKSTTTNIQSQLNALVLETSGDSNAEVVQARVGQDGATYETLKERLDTEQENIQGEVEQLKGSIGSVSTNVYDMFDNCTLYKNKYINGYSTSTFLPTITTDTTSGGSKRFVVDFKIPENIAKVKIKFPTSTVSNQLIILYKENSKAFNRTYSQLTSTWSGNGIIRVAGDDFYTLNLSGIIKSGYDHVCFAGLMSDLESMYMVCDGVKFNWLSIPEPDGYDEVISDIATIKTNVENNKQISAIDISKYDMFKSSLVNIQQNKYIPNVNTSTFLPNISDDGSNSRFVVSFDVPENIEKVTIPFPSASISNQLFVLTMNNTFVNYTYSQISSGYNGNGISYVSGSDYYTFNFKTMRELNIVSISFVGLMNDLNSMYMICDGVSINWLNTNDNDSVDKLSDVDLVLPPRIYGVVGMETNVYFDNLLYGTRINNIAKVIVKQPDSVYGDTQCYELTDRLIWNPTASVNVSKKAQLYKYTTTTVDIEKSVQFVATPSSAGNGRTRKVLCIGDSKIDNGILTPYLYQDGVDDTNLHITCIGTRGPENGRHEGRSGWKASDYCTKSSYNNKTNAFFNNNTFDFSYYIQNSGVSAPDYVFINLGTNDSATDGYDADTFISYLNTMINSIRAYSSSIIICIGMCEGVCTNTTDYHYEWNDSIQLYHKALIDEFSTRENEKIFLCPLYVSMDLNNDYPNSELPLSKRDDTVGTEKTRHQISDHLHQNRVGYYKNADMMFSLIKYIENLIDNNQL